MSAQNKPTRPGYNYRKARQHDREDKAQDFGLTPSRLRFRIFGLHWQALSLYRQAGCPFGESDAGMLLWLEFGRRSFGN